MTKPKTLKDLKLHSCIVEGRIKHNHMGSFGEHVGKLDDGFLKKDLKQMAIEYQILRRATPKDNKISLYFHCKACLEAGNPSQVDVGFAGSQSRFVVECKNCKKLVKVIDLAETQADIVTYIFNLTEEDLKEVRE